MLMPIEKFPFGKQSESNPMHERVLLLELRGLIGKGRHFTVGYYDAMMDVFCTWPYPGFMQVERQHKYDEIKIESAGAYCIMPKSFMHPKGPKLIKGFVPLDEALDKMNEQNLYITDIDKYLCTAKYCSPHLLCTNDGTIIISEVGCFCESGNQFRAFRPADINGSIYHASGPVPICDIKYAVDITKLEYAEEYELPRIVDADKLFDEIKKNDLSYMQQGDIMVCIKDIIERQVIDSLIW